MATLNDIGDAALVKLGTLGVGVTMTSAQDTLVLNEANRMLETWNNDGLKIPARTIEDLTLVASQQSYTIGPGGNFNTARPYEITAANVFDAADTFIINRLVIRDATWWAERRPRAEIDTLPRDLYYNPTYGASALGTIFLSPAPDAAYILELHSWGVLGSFAAISTTVAFPPGYEDLMVYGLAKRLWPVYPNPAVLNSINEGYRIALKGIRDKNSTVPYGVSDYPKSQVERRWIESGDWG